jgi:hypothetical protein
MEKLINMMANYICPIEGNELICQSIFPSLGMPLDNLHENIEIEKDAEGGYRVVAKSDIEPNTVICECEPFIEFKMKNERKDGIVCFEDTFPLLCSLLNSSKKIEILTLLSSLSPRDINYIESSNLVKNITAYNPEDGKENTEYLLLAKIIVCKILHNIYYNKDCLLLYYSSSFINHSCIPNCRSQSDEITKIQTVKSTKKILKGDEITISYRTTYTEKLPFKCSCLYCTDVIRCHYCKTKKITLKRCLGCGNAYYCNTECRKAHWKIHKTSCKK